MTEITYDVVAAAAEAIAARNEEPGVRSIRAHLGGGSNTTLTPLVAQWKKSRAKSAASEIKVSPAICDLIVVQILDTAAKATNDIALRAEEAEEAFAELAGQMTNIQGELFARNEELTAARAQLLQQRVQLQEREREMEESRVSSTQSIKEADERAGRERAQAESLRQDLVRATLRLEAVPGLEAALQDARQLVNAANDEVARSKQAAAVAIERSERQAERARDAASREAKTELQLQRLHEDREKALAAERALQQEIQRLLTVVSSQEARSAVLLAEVVRLRKTQNDAGDPEPAPTQPERRAA